MNIRTLFGSVIGSAIALLIAVVLVLSLDEDNQDPMSYIPFGICMTLVGGVAGGAIASPVPDPNQLSSNQVEDRNHRH